MAYHLCHPLHLINNITGKATAIIIAILLFLALAGGGGYWAFDKLIKKEPLRTQLSSMKMTAELIRFTHDRISTALYHNLVVLDDILVMMNDELKRLKRIGSKFPNQHAIVAPQTQALTAARDRLAQGLAEVSATIENIYVTWLVDRSTGDSRIKSLKGSLTRQVADAIRAEAVIIGRIRSTIEAST